MNNKTTKYRITVCLICLSCLVCTVSCGSKPENEAIPTSSEQISETSSVPSDEEEPDFELSFPEEATRFKTPELSEAIPDDAVTKLTITKLYQDGQSEGRIEYLNEHDDSLLTVEFGPEGEKTVSDNYKYEYNGNGDRTYEYDLKDYELSETYYEYDDKNRVVSKKNYDDKILSWETEYTYDEYDNIIIEDSNYYESGTGELLSNIVSDYSDCDYDDNGNILTMRYYLGDGELYRTIKYTYDSENRILTEFTIRKNSEGNSYTNNEIYREYDPVCGEESRTEDISYDSDGSWDSTLVYEREFDSSGRVTHVTKTYKNDETETVTEISYEYEEL